ncbi:MAG: GspE/PulE family protein [Candidatus Geothermincolia bacterium]
MRSGDLLSGLLLDRKLVTPEQLQAAQEKRKDNGLSLAKTLISMGILSEKKLAEFIAEETGHRFIDLVDFKVDIQATTTIDEAMARRHLCLPIAFEGDKLLVAVADPGDIFAIDDIRLSSGHEVIPVICSADDIARAIDSYYHLETDVVNRALEARVDLENDEEAAHISAMVDDAPVVRFANLIITEAINRGASDIHIDPREDEILIRYRIDGVCQEVRRSPRNILAGIVSRIKIMSDLNIAEKRIPQDGHFGMVYRDKSIDFRVAILPTIYGEKVVMRILDKSSIMLRLDDLGFLSQSLEKYTDAFTRPHGSILVTGPTGSGKSTTLYATLNVLNTVEKNITTVEDPVEYRLAGINQVQVNPKAGLTFASALRNILRTTPDILMVGEIRDMETARIAIESALTGHLVLSTLHTNDAPSALPRLIEMGVEPFLVSSAINCVLAQRLVRKLCPVCKVAYEADPEALRALGFPVNGNEAVLYRPSEHGCAKCSSTGYKGRIGLYEVMPMSDEIQRLTVKESAATVIMNQAISEGLLTMKDDGFEKAKLGITSVEEVLRVVTV